MYAIQEIQKYYGFVKTFPVLKDNDDVRCFRTRGGAEAAREELLSYSYHLRHNQFGYDYKILDLSKPLNLAWFKARVQGPEGE